MKNTSLIPIGLTLLLLAGLMPKSEGQSASGVKIARLKYQGGGDWYSDPTSVSRLVKFTNKRIGTNISSEPGEVEPSSPELFNYPLIYMTGHGNVKFSDRGARNLRKYLKGGGFLHIDDNYGMDEYIRTELKKVFPDQELVELPFDHPIYHQAFDFEQGLPAIHKHDPEIPPKGLGILYKGELVVFYSYQSDLGDGWEAPEVHNDPREVRMKALKMGANILQFAFMKN